MYFLIENAKRPVHVCHLTMTTNNLVKKKRLKSPHFLQEKKNGQCQIIYPME